MDQFPRFGKEEDSIERWLARLELRFEHHKIENDSGKKKWLMDRGGRVVEERLSGMAEDAKYEDLRRKLVKSLKKDNDKGATRSRLRKL